MLRAFYISISVLWIIFILVCFFMMEEVSRAKWDDYPPYDSYGYNSYTPSYRHHDSTVTAALISLVMFLICIAVEIITLIKLKSKTMKVLTIIGLSLTGIVLFFDGIMLVSPGSASFDEIGGVFVFFAVVQLAFSIVGTVHAFKLKA